GSVGCIGMAMSQILVVHWLDWEIFAIAAVAIYFLLLVFALLFDLIGWSYIFNSFYDREPGTPKQTWTALILLWPALYFFLPKLYRLLTQP
ncbi:MAG: hypothetical protein WBA17_14185, partial [Saprospiraceae bacterium]